MDDLEGAQDFLEKGKRIARGEEKGSLLSLAREFAERKNQESVVKHADEESYGWRSYRQDVVKIDMYSIFGDHR
ncbi:MAG: hypothetical protein ABEJ03_01715 [Candidatus Nanohaloarchaea archaeon]